MKLEDVKFGSKGRDRIVGITGTVTGKAEYQDGDCTVLIEGVDPTGCPLKQWVELNRFEPTAQ